MSARLPDLAEDKADTRLLGGQANIHRERQRRADSHGSAVYRGNHRFFTVEDGDKALAQLGARMIAIAPSIGSQSFAIGAVHRPFAPPRRGLVGPPCAGLALS